jgi:hypothetical protein
LRLDFRLSALIGHQLSSVPDARRRPASGWIILFLQYRPGLVPVLHHFTLRLPDLTYRTLLSQRNFKRAPRFA